MAAVDSLFAEDAQLRLWEVLKNPEVQAILSKLLAQRQQLLQKVKALDPSLGADTLPAEAARHARKRKGAAEVTDADVQEWLDRAAAGTIALSRF